MYKKILFTLFLCGQFVAHTSSAQNRREKVESIKIAYLSEKMNLEPRTAEKFWPIYNQYDDEMRKVIQESKKANDNRSPEEILDQEQKAIDIKRKYSNLFLKVVSNEQLSQLYKSEKEFHQILIRRMNKMEQKQQSMQNRSNDRLQDRPNDRMRNSRPPMNQNESGGMGNRPPRSGNR